MFEHSSVNRLAENQSEAFLALTLLWWVVDAVFAVFLHCVFSDEYSNSNCDCDVLAVYDFTLCFQINVYFNSNCDCDVLAVYDRVGRAEGLIENHTSTLSSMIYQQIPRENTNITRQCKKSGLRRECKHHNVKNRPSERIQTSQENVKIRPKERIQKS